MSIEIKVARAITKGHIQLWPVTTKRTPISWYPAQCRLIGLIRSNEQSFVLPPAVIQKPVWREQ